jgi:hypothetical protein
LKEKSFFSQAKRSASLKKHKKKESHKRS